MRDARKRSQVAPESTASARAANISCSWRLAATDVVTDRAMKAENIATPPTTRLDAKCTAREAISGSSTAEPSFAHVEAEAPLCGMGVDRKRVPGHAVTARRQRTHTETHDVAADALPMIHPRAGCVVTPAAPMLESRGVAARSGAAFLYTVSVLLEGRRWRKNCALTSESSLPASV